MCTQNDIHGHSYSGGVCLSCGRHQVGDAKQKSLKIDLSSIEFPHKKADGIHGAFQAFILELTYYFNEPTKFAMYAGAVKRTGEQKTREIFSYMKERGIQSGRYFFACMRK